MILAGHHGRLIWLRRAVQLACLVLLLWLFRRSATPAGVDYTALSGIEWWSRLDPLAQASAVLAGRSLSWLLWPSLLAVVLALFAGRAFCGWICPLGTLLDLWGRCTGWLRRLTWRGRAAPAWARQVRFVVLLAVLLVALGGLQLVGLGDPFSLLVRALAAADPLLRDAADAASGAALGTAAEPASEAIYQTLLPWMSARTGAPALWWASLGLLAGVFLLELAGRRGWCRWVCPLGAFYGVVGRWAPLLRLPGKACATCGTCRTSCDLRAFADDGSLRRADCTLCLRCVDACGKGIARVGVAPQPMIAAQPDPARRRLLIAGATLAAAPLAAAVAPLRPFGRRDPPADLLRPPGVAADEAGFLQRCIRCGACLAACPEGALHGDGFTVGLPGLLAPTLVPRRGACAPGCTRCGEVCPTGAIPRLEVQAKAGHPIGLAVVDEQRCIPFISAESCLVCEEHCPVADKAIRLEPGPHGYDVPRVRSEPCTGCGWCELVCPLDGQSAIRVFRISSRKNS